MDAFEDAIRLPIGTWVRGFINFLKDYLGGLFDAVATVFTAVYDVAAWVFTTPPFWAIILVFAAVARLVQHGNRQRVVTGIDLVFVQSAHLNLLQNVA